MKRIAVAIVAVALASLLAAAVAPRRADAAGFAVVEMGTRKMAMGAVIGRPDDLSAIYHNPAGLILTRGTTLYVHAGLMLPTTNIRLRPWKNSDKYITEPVLPDGYYTDARPSRAFGVIPMLVGSTDFGRDDLVVALGTFAGNAAGGAFADDSVARYHLLDSYVMALYFTGAIAWRPHRYITIGAAASLLYLRIKAERRFFPAVNGLDLSGLLGGRSMLELGGADWQGRGTFGLLFTPHPRLSIGAAVLTRVNINLQGDVSLTSGEDAPRPFKLEGTQQTALLFPWAIHVGANVDVLPWLEFGFEVRFWLYSAFEEQRTKVSGIDLIDELVVPKNYHASIQASGGIRIAPPQVPGLDIMLGVHYDRTPAPDNTVSIEQPTFNHVGIHSGVRYRFNKKYRLSLTYAHYRYLERGSDASLNVNPPSNFRARGTGNFLHVVLEVTFDPFRSAQARTRASKARNRVARR